MAPTYWYGITLKNLKPNNWPIFLGTTSAKNEAEVTMRVFKLVLLGSILWINWKNAKRLIDNYNLRKNRDTWAI